MCLSGWKIEVAITLPMVLHCPFQRSQWIDKSKTGGKLARRAGGDAPTPGWALHRQQGHIWAAAPAEWWQPDRAEKPLVPQTGAAAERCWCTTALGSLHPPEPLVIRTGTQNPQRKSCSPTKPFFSTAVDFYYKRAETVCYESPENMKLIRNCKASHGG